MLVDSHAHLNFPDYEQDLETVIAKAKEAGVEKIINIGTNPETSRHAIELAQKFARLFATVGIHPNDDINATLEKIDWEEFTKLAKQPRVVGVGECGLDYSELQEGGNAVNSPQEKDRQGKTFQKQIEIAIKLELPLSIHIRDAQNDLLRLFLDHLRLSRGVFHCFSGDEKYLNYILEKLPSFYISFAGNITFKNAQVLRELAKGVPLDRLLLETDCPFLSPQPHRGKRNEPANVRITAQTLANLYNVSFEELAKVTTENTESLFKIYE